MMGWEDIRERVVVARKVEVHVYACGNEELVCYGVFVGC